jgi:hypothetical protein
MKMPLQLSPGGYVIGRFVMINAGMRKVISPDGDSTNVADSFA